MVKVRSLRSGRMLVILLAAILVVFGMAIAFPTEANAFNGYLEDCDFDGHDDETKAPVPWYGFDETKGDKVPSDWDGVAGSYTFKPSGSTSNSGSGTSSSTSSSSSKNSSSSSSATKESSSGSSTPESTKESSTIEEAAVPIAELSAEAQAIIAVKGKLDVTAVSGSETLYRGSKIVVKGQGFAGDAFNLSVEIHSNNPQVLFTANTTADGSFEAEVTIPEDLELGKHDIIIYYAGAPIVKKTIELAEGTDIADESVAKAAPTDKGGINTSGLILLAALVIVAAAALLGWKAKKNSKAKSDAAA